MSFTLALCQESAPHNSDLITPHATLLLLCIRDRVPLQAKLREGVGLWWWLTTAMILMMMEWWMDDGNDDDENSDDQCKMMILDT